MLSTSTVSSTTRPTWSPRNTHRYLATDLQRRYAANAIGARRGLHHGDRADLLSFQACLMDEQVDMSLEETAGAKLDDAAHPISTNALTNPFLSRAQRGMSPTAPARVVR